MQVFDVPSVHVVVGSQNRRRHDARSITELLKKLNAPPGKHKIQKSDLIDCYVASGLA